MIAERNPESGRRVVGEIEEAGGKALFVETDVADAESVQSMAEATDAAFGRIDILVNNAAIFSTLDMRRFDQIPLDEWDAVMRVNITGPFLCARAVAPMMRRRKFGRIVNMSSVVVSMGRVDYLHYVTSKAALIGMTRSLARELGADGVTVNAILPSATYTEIERKTVTPEQKKAIAAMQCIPRPEVPEDLIGTLLFLASDASAFMTGQSLAVDGGASHL